MRKRSWYNIYSIIEGLVIGILGVIVVCNDFINHNFGIEVIIPIIVTFYGFLLAGIAYIDKR